jgi:hypothetical protein
MPEKQYKTTNIVLKKKDSKLLQYCFENAQLAKLFRNAVIYRCRQLYFAYRKSYQNLTQQEQDTLDEFAVIGITFPLNNKYQYIELFVSFAWVVNNSIIFISLLRFSLALKWKV